MMMLLIFISSCVGGAAAEVEAEDGVDDQSVFLSVMQSCFLLNSTLQSTEGVLSSFRTTWQEFVEDLGFWRVLLLLLLVITLLCLSMACFNTQLLCSFVYTLQFGEQHLDFRLCECLLLSHVAHHSSALHAL
ncbi:ankyrin repeat domain-containing protein 46 [Oreochromis niloticus]|uniref:ankyrin repeat domain-containing protein 46 n=1 Tax=Oreochromis niloticus TaxID=8128 RepID=UPI000DF2CE86|nr:ankyrin repeat domain-containing protein 46-like [Oreochromis niloticus]